GGRTSARARCQAGAGGGGGGSGSACPKPRTGPQRNRDTAKCKHESSEQVQLYLILEVSWSISRAVLSRLSWIPSSSWIVTWTYVVEPRSSTVSIWARSSLSTTWAC